ncbi:MFS transporter [Nocardia cyriacigeorgica]|uniref:MFS transporter n=1 Tax=Nocardia cyriacigeorgica TaxID=135487 RepID=UPI0024552EC2|nr:MFS transporter [Nocardia cyriacigeorgica]BDU06673.1 MFS transporter [Nocardia cyriacigeorgica]
MRRPGTDEETAVAPARAGALLTVVCAAQFMVVLDISVVNVALPSMRTSLGFTDAGLAWVVNAYALVFAGLLLVGGRLADVFGRKRVFLAGLLVFTVASLVGGLASSPGWLIGARAVQGVGAAVLAPATLTILTTSFAEGPRRTKALAVWTALGLAGGTAGNLLGGVLTEFASWRATLLINLPVGVLVLVVATAVIAPDSAPRARVRLDVAGAVLVTCGLAAIAYGFGQAAARGWSAPGTVSALAAGAGLVAVFVFVETRWVPVPLLPLALLRIRSVAVGNVAMLLAGACLNPMWFFLTLSMRDVLGYTPMQTGLAFLPHTLVTIAVGTQVTPWLMRRVEARVLIAGGALLAAAGFAWQAQLGTDDTYLTGILGPALVFSIGAGLLNTPLTAAVTAGVPAADAGAASGLMNTTKQVGAALGLAALITATAGSVPGYDRAFWLIAVAMIAVAAIAAGLPAHRDRR